MNAYFRYAVVLLLALWAASIRAGAPELISVRFEGPVPPGVDDLLAAHPPGTGKPFDPARAGTLSDAILEAWRLEAYPLAKVSWTAGPGADSPGLELVYRSEPGQRGKLEELRFDGNRLVPDETLTEGLKLVPRPGMWNRFTGRDLLYLEDLSADASTLLDTYHRLGFMNIEIGSPEVVYVSELEGYRVRWPISEGEPYRLGAVSFSDDTPETARRLAEEAGQVSGARFSPVRLTRLRERIVEHFHNAGYAFPEFNAEPSWRDEEAMVDLRISVVPGPRVGLGEVKVSGNAVTDDRVIRRELALRGGEAFHPGALRAFESRLINSGLFSSVDLQYRQSGPDLFDVEVAVEESRTGRLETGVSYGTEEGPAFLLTAREANFSLRPPFRGDALIVEAGAMVGPEIVRLNAGMIHPGVGDGFWRIGADIFYEDNRYLSDLYDQRSHGLGILAAYPLTGRLSVFTGPQWTFYRLEGIQEGLEDRLIEETAVDLGGWRAGWEWNRTDRAFRPRKGVRLEQEFLYGTEWLGGNTEVLEVTARGAVYLNPFEDHVLLIRAGIHSIESFDSADRVPVALRSYLGGVSNLRGFEYRSVSPLDENGNVIGGQSAWWASVEYLLPVLPRLDLSLYLDAGDVSPDSYTFSDEGPVTNWGLGILIRAENFPVRLDLAFPMEVLDRDRINESGEPHLSFSAGYTF